MSVAMPAMTASVSMEEMDALELRFLEQIKARLPETTTFQVRATGSRGTAKNALIATVQAAHQRNPFWLPDKTKGLIAFAARGLFTLNQGARRRAEEVIKTMILEAFGENLHAQRNPGGGAFRPLTERYAAMKRRKFGFVTPILSATKELMSGLKVEVRRT